MNRDRLEGNWKQLKGTVREKWGVLTGDPLAAAAGKRGRHAGMVQEAYGLTLEATKKVATVWQGGQEKESANK